MTFFDFLYEEYLFNRWGIKDMSPYRIVDTDDGVTIILNTLGISPEGLEISVEKNGYNENSLNIQGHSKNKILDREISINMKFATAHDINDIEWESENGLTYLYVKFVKPIKTEPSVKITRRK